MFSSFIRSTMEVHQFSQSAPGMESRWFSTSTTGVAFFSTTAFAQACLDWPSAPEGGLRRFLRLRILAENRVLDLAENVGRLLSLATGGARTCSGDGCSPQACEERVSRYGKAMLDAVLSLTVLAAILLIGAFFLWRRTGNAKNALLMVLLLSWR